jgi:hypothetical protein
MMKTGILFLVLIAGASAALRFDEADAKNRPVTKVVTLLKDMSAQLEKEGEEDEEVYDKMVCWCETNDKEKTQAIADAEQSITDLSAQIEEMTGLSARLSAEIATLNTEVAENSDALDKATAMREKELAEFTASESESLAGIASLGKAVDTLSAHNSLVQTSDGALAGLRADLSHTMKKNAAAVGNMLMPSEKRMLTAFVQAPEDFLSGGSFAQQSGPQNAGSYAPQSGAIFGVLKNMKETFEANLAAAQKEESDSERAYRELKTAKESEIAAGTKQIETKTIQMSNADQKKAEATQDREDTTNTMNADSDFLGKLKEHCALADKEMEARSKARTEEIGAVSKALAVLTSDDAHDLFTKTLGFIQKESSVKSQRRQAVMKLLATKPKLAALATHVKLAAFGKVKDTLEKMITDLTKEKEDEIALKDWCYDEIRKNERTTEMTDRTKEGLVAKIDDLANTIDTLTKEIAGLNADIAENQVQLKRASEDRELENKIFQQTVADQQATAALLTKALNVLQATFKKASLLQKNAKKSTQPAGPPPPPGFGGYKQNAQSGGVMGMIEMIINDAKAMEAEAVQDELSAQQAYEDFVLESNNAKLAAQQEIMNKSNDKAKAEGDKTETEVELDTTMDELEQLAKENMDLHGECDYTIKNFDVRQSSRDSEIEALKQSVAILSGASLR